jgi:hypothetical protein
MCLANNISQCHWGNMDADGFEDGGWSEVYDWCELWNLPEVNQLEGEKDITTWCNSQAA